MILCLTLQHSTGPKLQVQDQNYQNIQARTMSMQGTQYRMEILIMIEYEIGSVLVFLL